MHHNHARCFMQAAALCQHRSCFSYPRYHSLPYVTSLCHTQVCCKRPAFLFSSVIPSSAAQRCTTTTRVASCKQPPFASIGLASAILATIHFLMSLPYVIPSFVVSVQLFCICSASRRRDAPQPRALLHASSRTLPASVLLQLSSLPFTSLCHFLMSYPGLL